jgi:hypothetical protein
LIVGSNNGLDGLCECASSIADAVLDRVVRTTHRITLDGETTAQNSGKIAKRGKRDTDVAE